MLFLRIYIVLYTRFGLVWLTKLHYAVNKPIVCGYLMLITSIFSTYTAFTSHNEDRRGLYINVKSEVTYIAPPSSTCE